MTTDQAIINTRLNIVDPDRTNGRFTDTHILTALNMGRVTVARALKFPTRISTTTSVKDQQEYVVATQITQINDPVTYDGIYLYPLEYDQVVRLQSPSGPGSTRIISGVPETWYVRDQLGILRIGLYPVPNEAGKTINYINSYIPDTLTLAGTMPYSNDDYNDLIVLYATIVLLKPEQMGRDHTFIDIYTAKLVDGKLELKNMGVPEYVNYIES